MKNLANCKPSEFLAQTVRIKRAVEGWMNAVNVIEIMRTKANIEPIPFDASEETRKAIFDRNTEAIKKQGVANVSRLFDAAFEQNPQKTLEILALCCFVEPQNVDDNPMSFYMKSVAELINNEDVLSFFTSLAQLAQMNTSAQ